MKVAAIVLFGLLLAACGGQAATKTSPTASALAQASGKLGPETAMPATFPSDVPVYPKARLTQAAGFPSNSPTSWGMEWQTLDAVAKVQAFYTDKMNQGDWTLSATSSAGDDFRATFGRKSNRNVIGTLEATSGSGVTKILMSLVTPASGG